MEAVQTASLEFLSFAECGKLTFLCMLSVCREQVSHITDCLFADCVLLTIVRVAWCSELLRKDLGQVSNTLFASVYQSAKLVLSAMQLGK